MNTEMFDTQHLQAKARLVNYKIVVLRVEETTIESRTRAVVSGGALAPPEFGVSEKRTEKERDSLLKFIYFEKATKFCKTSTLFFFLSSARQK